VLLARGDQVHLRVGQRPVVEVNLVHRTVEVVDRIAAELAETGVDRQVRRRVIGMSKHRCGVRVYIDSVI
jgi:phosphopantothenate synthetase